MKKVYLVLKNWTDSNESFVIGMRSKFDRYFNTEEEALECIEYELSKFDNPEFQFEIKVIYHNTKIYN